jgi:predicted HTH transcriptional regulator
VVARTIAGFMNTKGGTLLIGVEDDKTTIGLDRDYNTLKKKNNDGFLIHLSHIINNYLGKEFSAFWSANIIRNKGIDICRIDVSPANRPVYTKRNNQEEFFVRVSATTEPMQIKEAHEYIKIHWEK